jgi:hypothetical protein
MDCIKDKDTTEVFTYLKKRHSKVKVDIENKIQGEIKITSVRKYLHYPYSLYPDKDKFRYEVDVEFTGDLWGRVSNWGAAQRCSYGQIANLSKIRAYRLIRKIILPKLKDRLILFGVDITDINDIKKLKWVG